MSFRTRFDACRLITRPHQGALSLFTYWMLPFVLARQSTPCATLEGVEGELKKWANAWRASAIFTPVVVALLLYAILHQHPWAWMDLFLPLLLTMGSLFYTWEKLGMGRDLTPEGVFELSMRVAQLDMHAPVVMRWAHMAAQHQACRFEIEVRMLLVPPGAASRAQALIEPAWIQPPSQAVALPQTKATRRL